MSVQQTVLKVSGMSCGHCVKAVEGALSSLGAKGEVSLAEGTVNVTFDPGSVTLDQIRDAIEDQGYDVAKA
ncbi:heavy-metal-associated domain-containing protein [Paenibacillus sp. PR3]|uniref:Heavy-metal-associated domain-containing protein n=1 Tax=Paenibacillus terricola TaxID=2763503 RepID=A0ABR8MYU1_9BACL|nr:cation transporter [Paenibacillus terricola]MBD3921113.1 heavy-metal-associated domain-containing protein [Paenibacillus terricola]